MESPTGELPAAPGTAWLDEDSIRRLCLALIAGEQDRMIREGRLGPDTHVRAVLTRSKSEPDGIRIDEADLGLDSLARIDLVSDLTGFFDLASTGVEDYLLIERTLGDWVRRIAWHVGHVGMDAVIGFSTSGSTGKPRRIPRARAELDAEIRAIVSEVLPRCPPRVLSLVSPRHLYGFLWSVLLPRALGIPCVDLQDGPPTRIAAEARPGDLVLATPFQWDRCASLRPPAGGHPRRLVRRRDLGSDMGRCRVPRARGAARDLWRYGNGRCRRAPVPDTRLSSLSPPNARRR